MSAGSRANQAPARCAQRSPLGRSIHGGTEALVLRQRDSAPGELTGRLALDFGEQRGYRIRRIERAFSGDVIGEARVC
jgi:hypothetical protein